MMMTAQQHSRVARAVRPPQIRMVGSQARDELMESARRLIRAKTRDNGMRTIDQRTIDSTGAFLLGQLELLDRTIHEPLQAFTWSRDLEVRTDVTMAHDFSSYTNQAMGSVGGVDPTSKAWISKDSSTLPNVAIDVGKTASPLFPWGLEVSFTIFELQSSQLLGQGIDEQKFKALKRKQQQDTDIQAYLGDTTFTSYGLLNSPQVTETAAVTGAWTGGTTTALQILNDINTLLEAVWASSGYTYCPSKLLLPPLQYAYLTATPITIGSSAVSQSLLTFLEENSISLRTNGKKLEILPCKWLTGTTAGGQGPGTSGEDRMVAYTQEYDLVRFPMVPVQGLPVQFKGAAQIRPYVCKLGCVEFVYPETVGYVDGI